MNIKVEIKCMYFECRLLIYGTGVHKALNFSGS